MSSFKWTARREKAALVLAQGYTLEEAAHQSGVTIRTISRWKNNLEFMQEVDRLTFLVGISKRSERLRIAMKFVRQKVQSDDNVVTSKRDLLDWMKYIQSETDGAKIDLTTLFENLEKSTTADDDQDNNQDTS